VRTTLSIDDRALAAARSRARQRGITVGEALSELALIGYGAETADVSVGSGFPMLPLAEGHVITVELVDDALDE
jgi:hypothetical protein